MEHFFIFIIQNSTIKKKRKNIPGICTALNGSHTITETTHTTIVLRLSNTMRVVALQGKRNCKTSSY